MDQDKNLKKEYDDKEDLEEEDRLNIEENPEQDDSEYYEEMYEKRDPLPVYLATTHYEDPKELAEKEKLLFHKSKQIDQFDKPMKLFVLKDGWG